MGIFSSNRDKSEFVVDWLPLPPPRNDDEYQARVSLSSAMRVREPTRMNDYFSFTYLGELPETLGITEEVLIATGPSTLFFTDKSQPATAYLTNERIVHLALHKGWNFAIGSSHSLLEGFRRENFYQVTVNWYDDKCSVLGFGPRFGKDGKQNRYALEWWYSYGRIVQEHFAK